MHIRNLVKVGLAVGCILSAAGCTSTTDGTPIAVPDTTVPTTGRTPPTSTLPGTPPPTSPRPPAGQTLPANEQGYVYIETETGKTRCQISTDSVGCEAQFSNPPKTENGPANGVIVTPDGELQWIAGNLGDIPVVTLDYATYQAQGWTIEATEAGTTFTNGGTGHGMFVSVERVDSF